MKRSTTAFDFDGEGSDATRPATSDWELQNAMLKHLPEVENRLLEQNLTPMALRPRDRLVEKDTKISDIHFLDEGWASVMSGGSMRPVEVAMIGVEGVIGISVFLGVGLASNNCIMQTEGRARRIATVRLQKILPQAPILRQRILGYVHRRLLQSYSAVVATTVGSLEARVCRVILMCHDRSPSDEISITQDQLARKIGANRAGVTNVLHLLEGQRMIASKRRCVLVMDRSRLETAAAGTYSRT